MTHLTPLISADEIRAKIHAMAPLIDRAYSGEELTLVVVMKGAFCFASDLMRCMKTPLRIDFIQASSYGERGSHRGDLSITHLKEIDCTDRHLLLIDDILDSGETLSHIAHIFQEKQPKSIKSLVLLRKKSSRPAQFSPDWVLFEIENAFVVGYGLDYKERYRELPGIYTISESE